MVGKRRVISRPAWLLLIGLSPVLSGCAEELGPVPMPVTSTRGVVRNGSRPVAGGWIEFVPVEGTVGKLRSAKLHEDGSFVADGVPVGRNLIRLVNARIESPGMSNLFGSFASPIRRDIPAQPGNPLTIDLAEEESQFRKSRLRESRGSEGPR